MVANGGMARRQYDDIVTARVYRVHMTNVEQNQVVADPQMKLTDSGREYAAVIR